MAWKEFRKLVRGVRVDGDLGFPRATAWNLWGLVNHKKQELAVFEVDLLAAKEGYRIGFRTETGTAKLQTELLRSPNFAVRIDREPRIFFAVDREDYEVPIRLLLHARLF